MGDEKITWIDISFRDLQILIESGKLMGEKGGTLELTDPEGSKIIFNVRENNASDT